MLSYYVASGPNFEPFRDGPSDNQSHALLDTLGPATRPSNRDGMKPKLSLPRGCSILWGLF